VLLSGKNNLSRDVGGLAYEIEEVEVDKAKGIEAQLRDHGHFRCAPNFSGQAKNF
jgi:hypothetical protein